jgi:putative ABC transport system permease protein
MTADYHNRMCRLIKMVRMAARALMSHKLRSALSVVGIVCGVMAVLSMISIGEGARDEALRQIEQLGTRNIYLKSIQLTGEQVYRARRKLSVGLSADDAAMLKRNCQLLTAVGFLKEFSASLSGSGRQITPQFVACSASIAELQQLHLRSGRFIRPHDVEKKNQVCVLGSGVARRLGPSIDVGSSLRIGDHLFKIVGVLERRNRRTKNASTVSTRNINEMIFVPLGLESLAGHTQSGTVSSPSAVTEIVVQAVDTDQVADAATIVERLMEVAHHGVRDFQMIVPQELLKQSENTRRMFNIVLGAIAGISLLVGGIGIMNIMLATVSERTREIGIRRAVGATRTHIVGQFLAESVILTGVGGIAGIAAGFAAVRLITAIAGWQTVLTFTAVCLPLLMSLLVGIFFGLYPACRAAFMNPIVALRHE